MTTIILLLVMSDTYNVIYSVQTILFRYATTMFSFFWHSSTLLTLCNPQKYFSLQLSFGTFSYSSDILDG